MITVGPGMVQLSVTAAWVSRASPGNFWSEACQHDYTWVFIPPNNYIFNCKQHSPGNEMLKWSRFSFSLVSIVVKQEDQKQLGKENIYFAYTSTSLFHVEGTWDQNSRQKPLKRNWCRGHVKLMIPGLLIMAYLLCFLIPPGPLAW